MRAIVPIADLGNRMPVGGRLRFGVKTAKAMRATDTWRATSPDETAIRQLAELYGGTATPWNDPKANPSQQWEVLTEAKELRVFLPPSAIDVAYEMWAGGGRVRRCDGVMTEVSRATADGAEPDEVPCVCHAKQAMECAPHTRLSVILPEIRFAGVWRLDTKSWNAAHELPAMERMIYQLQSMGIVEARLVLEKRQAKGGSRKFVVPKLVVDTTPLDMLAGAGQHVALHAGSNSEAIAAIEATSSVTDAEPPTPADWFDGDEEVAEGEIVDDPSHTPEVDHEDTAIQRTKQRAKDPVQAKLVLMVAELATRLRNEFAVDDVTEDDLRHALAHRISAGRTSSSKDLTAEEKSTVLDALEKVTTGATPLAWLDKVWKDRPT